MNFIVVVRRANGRHEIRIGRRILPFNRDTVFSVQTNRINSHYSDLGEIQGDVETAIRVYEKTPCGPGFKKRLLMSGDRRSHVLAREVNRGEQL